MKIKFIWKIQLIMISQAIQISNREKFDLVISDIGLPDGNGYDLIKHLQESYDHKLKGKK